MSEKVDSPVIVAFDTQSLDDLKKVASKLDPTRCRAKVGKAPITSCGIAAVRLLQEYGFDVFLDLKFHDIPNTVAKAVEAAAGMGVWMLNVHASGGERMLAAAREAADRSSVSPLLIAVTVLTSTDPDELPALGIQRSLDDQVRALATLAHKQALDGVVCSAQEANMLRKELRENFLLVTPGIRPADSAANDQRRICTPTEALGNGSNYLVIGRPITQAPDPALALAKICASLV